jgi:hypothetical protein
MRATRSAAVSSSTPQAFAGKNSGVVARHDAEVGDHHAVEAQASAQDAGDHVPVEGEADLLELGADRLAVVGHHPGRPRLEGGDERLQVVVEPTAGVDLVLAVAEVGVPAAPLGPPLKCLGTAATSGPGPACEPFDEGRDEFAGQVGVLAEALGDAGPARFGGEVDLGVAGVGEPPGGVFAADGVPEGAGGLSAAGGADADRLRPPRERRAGHVRAERVVGHAVARVAAECDRDPQWVLGRDVLHRVGCGHLPGAPGALGTGTHGCDGRAGAGSGGRWYGSGCSVTRRSRTGEQQSDLVGELEAAIRSSTCCSMPRPASRRGSGSCPRPDPVIASCSPTSADSQCATVLGCRRSPHDAGAVWKSAKAHGCSPTTSGRSNKRLFIS